MAPTAREAGLDGWPWWAFWVQTAIGGVAVYAFLLATLFAPTSASDRAGEYDGFLSIIGFFILLALVGVAVVVIVSLVVLVGLPIRLMPRLRCWVAHRPLVPGAIAAVGAASGAHHWSSGRRGSVATRLSSRPSDAWSDASCWRSV